MATSSSRAGVFGVLTGVWWALHFWLLELWAESGWPSFYSEDLRTGFVQPLGLRGSLAITAGFLIGIPVLFVGWARLERSTEMDPERLAGASLRWAGAVLRWPLVVLLLGALALFAAIPWLSATSAFFGPCGVAAVVASAAIALMAPFAILRAEVVSSPAGAKWWLPQWPGLGPLATVVGLEIALALVVVAVSWPGTAGAELAGAVVALVLGLFVAVAQAAALVFRVSPAVAFAKISEATRWCAIGPVLSLGARILAAVLAVLAPVSFVWYALWKLVPLHAQIYAGGGAELPVAMQWGVSFFSLAGRYYHLFLMGPLAVGGCMVLGRLVWLLRSPRFVPAGT